MNKIELRSAMPMTVENFQRLIKQRDYARRLAASRLDKLRIERRDFQEQLDMATAEGAINAAALRTRNTNLERERGELETVSIGLRDKLANVTRKADERNDENRLLRDELAGLYSDYNKQLTGYAARFRNQVNAYNWLLALSCVGVACTFIAGFVIGGVVWA